MEISQAPRKQKVFVGMSGGVDSSVSAALLKEAGHDVVGVFIKVWQADFLPCTWREERLEAMRAAAHLGIPFVTLDLEKEYKEEVVDYMVGEYEKGRVPNPDVMCNKHVKFGAFLNFAKRNDADFIATGHYARIEQNKDAFVLLQGVDKEKDQSYFLWTLDQEQLSHTLFPVGHLLKSDVRKFAEKFSLPNAQKKDSQGLCFMGPVDMTDFLRHFLKTEKGDVLDENGLVVGSHNGALLYTFGQRHGFSTSKRSSSEKPYHVIAKDIKKNTITVSQEVSKKNASQTVVLTGTNILDGGDSYKTLRIRHRGELLPISHMHHSSGNTLEVVLEQAGSDITPGQSAVIYEGEICLGGGIVA